MNFCWKNYINLAKELIEISESRRDLEIACLRSSISRFYYAIYGLARNYLIRKVGRDYLYNEENQDENIHQKVQNWFIGSNSEEEKIIGEHLKNMRLSRNKADYDNIYRGDLRRDVRLLDFSSDQALSYIEKLGNML